MSNPTALNEQIFIDLKTALDHCLIKDRFPLRRQIQQLRQAQADQVNKQLHKISERISQSQKVVESRSAALKLTYPPQLPVSERHDELLEAISQHQVVIIAGETGSGKTTQLPKLCLEAGRGRFGRIGHTQPRRLAARAVAERIADEIGTELGAVVGYQVRFTDQSSDSSRIKLMTDGILLAQTQRDRFLNEYDTLIIDEAHERSLNIDFLLGYLKQLLPKRPDLKIIITSATIDVERFSKHFNDAPVFEVSGRTYPVEIRYRSRVRDDDEQQDRTLFESIYDALNELAEEDKKQGQPGDTLVFLPGEREIRECAEYLRRQSMRSTDILPLYARLSGSDQQKIFKPHGGRRVVLSTNVAETSLTVPGIRYVIDSGSARISRYSYRSKVQRLPIEAISQASANQRAGRCGRTGPGICIRLYSEEDFDGRSEFTDPEIQRTNLASVILQMMHLRLGRIQDFPFVDMPDDRFIKDGVGLLNELGAVDGKGDITSTGTRMARLPVDPRIARLLLAAETYDCVNEMMIIASALSIQDPRERPPEKKQAAAEKHAIWRHDESDFMTLINLWNDYEVQRQDLTQNQLRKWCTKHFLSFMRMREWRDTHRQIHLLCRELKLPENESEASYEGIHKAMLTGMLANIGFRNEGNEFLGARNRKFLLFPGTALSRRSKNQKNETKDNSAANKKGAAKWIMAAELVETSKLYASTVARIEAAWIEEIGRPLLKYQYSEPHWESQRGQVIAFEQSSLYGLVINPKKRTNYAISHPSEARQIFINEALVAKNLRSKVDFYRKNCRLIEQVTEYEEKSRRRDLVIEDEYLIQHYQKYLPHNIASARQLERWEKTCQKNQLQPLYLTREQLLSDEAKGVTSNDYPSELNIDGLILSLSYSFAPGSIDDGVSVNVTLPVLRQLSSPQLEWLVPGFIEDKVVAIIKGLPKVIRKQFVPVPETARRFLAQANTHSGGLYDQLLVFLNAQMRPSKLTRDELNEVLIPDHLQMNIKLFDNKRMLAQSRDLLAMIEDFGQASQDQILDIADDRYQKSDISHWDFGDLPSVTETEHAGIKVRSFPCLSKTKEGIALTVQSDEKQAQVSHRQGLLELFKRSLPQQERQLKADIQKYMKPHWLLAKGLGSENELIQQLIDAVFVHVLLPQDQEAPRSQDDYQQRIARRDSLSDHLSELLPLYKEWLSIRHRVLKSMRGAISMDRAMTYSDVQFHLEKLLEKDFLMTTSWSHLKRFTRYLKAMEYRIEKLQGNQARDRLAMIEFASLYDPFIEALENQQDLDSEALQEFRWLLQEWRVSLYAQPLGTTEPVSLKRLQKRWDSIQHGV